jgi:hypothetical protein
MSRWTAPLSFDQKINLLALRYPVFSAITALHPPLHGAGGVQIAFTANELELRGISEQTALALSGRCVNVNGTQMTTGTLVPKGFVAANSLYSRQVIFRVEKGEYFDQLTRALPAGTVFSIGKQSWLYYKDMSFAGFEVFLQNLTDELSIEIQKNGIGKFRSMGCGVFRENKNSNCALAD